MSSNRKPGTIGGIDASLWVGRIVRSYHDGAGKSGHCIMARLHNIDHKRGIATITPTNHGHTEDVAIKHILPSWANNEDLHQLKLERKASSEAVRTSMEAAFKKAEAIEPVVSTQPEAAPKAEPEPISLQIEQPIEPVVDQEPSTIEPIPPPMEAPVITSHTEALPEVRFTLNRVSASSLRAVLEKIEALPRMEQDVRAAQAILIDHHEKYLAAKKELTELGVVFEAEPEKKDQPAPAEKAAAKTPAQHLKKGQLQENLQRWFRTSTIGFEQDGAKVAKALGINYGPRQTIEVAMQKGRLPAGSVRFELKANPSGHDTLTITRVK